MAKNNEAKITIPKLEARIKLFDDKLGRITQLVAFVELTVADFFVIKGIRVLARREGDDDARAPFVVFPAEKGRGRDMDVWYDIAHPANPEARAASISAILAAYEKAKQQAGN